MVLRLAEPPHTFAAGGMPLKLEDYFWKSKDPAEQVKFPRLSRPVPMMRAEYDVVVVGSGYGGGVAASRMSRAGKSVAVLEMGKERWPGEYPTTLTEVLPELHVSGNAGGQSSLQDAATGKSTGLYYLILGEGQNVFVGKGLGGTSLLNGNVFLECDKRPLTLNRWPPELRKDTNTLDEYYSRASYMLQLTPYPDDYPPLKKLAVLQKQAEILGYSKNFYRVPQTTFFKNEVNHAGVEMKASTGSGQDSTGINDDSKNSVLMNYLPDAWNWDAEIFCECECEVCFLGAGALGTTEILLRSRAHVLKTSPMVGQRLSGNGDILSFAYNTDEIVNGIGSENPPAEYSPGPTITGIIDNRGPETSPSVFDGYVIEEGTIPAALAPILQMALEMLPGKQYPKHYGVKERLRHLHASAKTRLFGPYAEGALNLKNDEPNLRFLGVGRTEHSKKLNSMLTKASSAIGGILINAPFNAACNRQGKITVHPLGGAFMSSDGTGRNGATNHLGQLFSGVRSEVYEGLVCVDGSVIPTSLGVNPLATITALAERSVDRIALQKKWKIDLATRNGKLDLFGEPAQSFPLTPEMKDAAKAIMCSAPGSGVRFTEIMDGHIYIGDDIDDFEVAENAAKGASSSARFYLSVDAYSVKTLIERDDHSSLAIGTFSCGALSKDPLLVLRGRVQFFTPDVSVADAKQLAYKLTLLTTDGQTYLLNGYKAIDSNIAFSVSDTWKAVTTLFVAITKPDGGLVGRGKLHISWRNFEFELKSFGTLGSGGLFGEAASEAGFLSYFARNIADYYLGPLRKLEYAPVEEEDDYVMMDIDTAGGKPGYLPKPEPVKIVRLKARDGIESTVRVWAPTGKAASRTEGAGLPILMVPGASVDHQIYALPTIEVNCVDYFTALGHTVYVLTPRFGIAPTARLSFTPADAAQDVFAAMEFVRKEEGCKKFYAIVHCQGVVATSVGMLNGSIPANWMAGMTITQVFIRHKFGAVNQVTGGTTLLPKLYRAIAGPWYPIVTPDKSLDQAILDQGLRFYPVGGKEELCNSAVCHRISLVYGRLWRHTNLNRETHTHLENFMTGAHTDFITNLLLMGQAGRVLDAQGRDTLLNDENLGRFEGLPMLLMSGGQNVVYDPETTSLCCDDLRKRFPGQEELYSRSVVEGYIRGFLPALKLLRCEASQATMSPFSMSLSHLERLPVELLYEIQLYSLSEHLPHTSKRLYSVFKSASVSFDAQYIFHRTFSRQDSFRNDAEPYNSILRYPTCTSDVFLFILTNLLQSPHSKHISRPELPRRLFRSLTPKKPPAKWRDNDYPLPFLELLYDSERSGIPAPNPNSHQGYALTKAVHAGFAPLVKFLLCHGATPALEDNKKKNGLTVLIAIRQKDLGMVKMLIEPGGASDGGGGSGRKRRKMEDRIRVTPEMLKTAVKCNAKDIVEYFTKEKGCVPDMQTLYLLSQ
ncbi:hypothetical protein V5O48_001533 [Marasmius crinis-equi]|uniref:Cholesterol oxidase n=1 Tax=Marasmius crinis-equi TaxID=585013 RepID=A0ABR3FY52_9AGAR